MTKGAAAVQSTGTSGLHFDRIFRERESFSPCMKNEEAKKGITDETHTDNERIMAYREAAEKDRKAFITLCSGAGREKYRRKTASMTEDIRFGQMAIPVTSPKRKNLFSGKERSCPTLQPRNEPETECPDCSCCNGKDGQAASVSARIRQKRSGSV